MKKRTLIVALLIAAVLCLSVFAGCAQQNAQQPAPAADDKPATQDAEPAAGQPGEEPAEAAPALKLGGIGPTTGGAAVYGSAARNGAQIAVDEINALGGMQFELNFQDDEHDAEKSVNAYNTLKDWGMQVLVGTVTTNPALAVIPECYADRIFALTPSASSPKVTEGNDNVFQMCFTDPYMGIASAQFIAEKDLASKVAVIYNNADAYSIGIYENFVSESKAQGLEVVSETSFTDDSASDFSVQITEAKNAGAELIFMPIYYTPASLILTQANGMNYKPLFFGVDGTDGILGLDGFDVSLAEGVMLLTPFSADATDELTVNFVKQYQEKHGELPNQFAADGYDCVYAIYEACQAAGVTSDMSNEEICDALIGQFADNMTFNGLTGEGVKWTADGAVTKIPMPFVIQDGKYVKMK